MTIPSYTDDQLQKLMNNYAKGVIKFRDGDQWVEFDSLSKMRDVIHEIRLELYPTKFKKTIGHIRTRVVNNY